MKYRTDERADVATPLWVLKAQNVLVDVAWFEDGSNLQFRAGCKWQNYVRARRLELACGDAPYLTSRYDALSKEEVRLDERVGLLDRKLQVVDVYADDLTWKKWALVALKATFGVEIKVDKVARARENLVKTLVEHYERRFGTELDDETIEQAQKISEENIMVLDALDEVEDQFFRWKFEAIVGNPPYHSIGGAGGSNDAPIYQEFVRKMLGLRPERLSLVIPARWFAGGRENLLGEFRREMMEEAGLKKLFVYAEAKEVFPWVSLSGGICYFLVERGYAGECDYILHENGQVCQEKRDFSNAGVLVREPILAGVVKKVEEVIAVRKMRRVEEIILGNTPFGISSDLYACGRQVPVFVTKTIDHETALYFFEKPRRVRRYIARKNVTKNVKLIERPKVILPAAGGTGNDKYIIGRPETILPPAVCSQTYLAAVFETEMEAENFEKYARTKFFRALVKASKVSQSAARRVYHFVPLEDLSAGGEIDWAASLEKVDQQLYAKYGLSTEETEYIEGVIEYF